MQVEELVKKLQEAGLLSGGVVTGTADVYVSGNEFEITTEVGGGPAGTEPQEENSQSGI